MSWRALVYAYVFGGLTLIPLLVCTFIAITIYTSVPVKAPTEDVKSPTPASEQPHPDGPSDEASSAAASQKDDAETKDLPKTRKGWLTVRRTFEESELDGSYMTLVRSYLDVRSRDPRRSRPKGMWYVVLKGKVLYLYEDDGMTECGVAIELGGHAVSIHPKGLADGELFTRRNAICLRPKASVVEDGSTDASADEETADGDKGGANGNGNGTKKRRSKERDQEKEASTKSAPWFIFVRSCVEMEDWYLALVHASDHPTGTPMLKPLLGVFSPSEMNHLVATLDEQPDVIPVRWLNALLGRIFFSFYKTETLESSIIARLMKKLSKVKRPAFLTEIAITRVSVGNKVPALSKPMLKELTKEGDASLEIGLLYKGEIRTTVEATAVINLGARFKPYAVKLVLAVVLRELEGNLLIKVKRPPSSRIWYAFTKPPRIVLNVEPIVSDRQITWTMILNTIESKLQEIIADSVVMPNMDDISFWDSSPYAHRGGVWSDAARTDKPMTPLAEEEKPPVLGSPSVFEEKKPLAAEEFTSGTPSLGESLRPVLATGSPDNISKPARRRSWFGAGEESDEGSVPDKDVASASRGRKNSAESTSQSAEGNVTPSANVASPVPADEQDTFGHLSLQYSPRPPSVHSQTRSSRTQSVSSSPGDDPNCLFDSTAASASASAPRSPRPPTAVSTTTSFLSTLRSKATDKQALSDTAGETIRKWGAKWATLRKDMGRSVSQEEVPDAGPTDHRARTEGAHDRPSYADVRASVAARREQSERAHRTSSPIPIPQHRSGSSSAHVGSAGSTSAPGETRAESLISTKGPGALLSHSVEDKGIESYERDFRYDADDHLEPPLIHTQPSEVRTMTIPATHPSHRGEPTSVSSDTPSPSPESKSRAQTTQSVYRLWRSPILSGQLPKTQTTTHPEGTQRDEGVTPSSCSSAAVEPSSKPVPPPLPPRSMSTVAVSKPASSVPEDINGSIQSVSPAVVGSEESAPDGHVDGQALVEAPEPAVARPTASKPPLPPRKGQQMLA